MPTAKKGWISAGYPDCTHKDANGDYCNICGCPLEQESIILSLESLLVK